MTHKGCYANEYFNPRTPYEVRREPEWTRPCYV